MFSRVILPLLLFVGMVAGIAWVTQYVPWHGSRPGTEAKSEPPPVLEFDQPVANWGVKKSEYLRNSLWLKVADGKPTPAERTAFIKLLPPPREGETAYEQRKDEELQALAEQGLSMYVKEYETNQGGSSVFTFRSVSDQEAEVGLKGQSCTCSDVKVCILDASQFDAVQKAREANEEAALSGLNWTTLKESNTSGVVVPPHARGLVRLSWKPREQRQEKFTLTIQMWSQPRGDPNARGKVAVLQTTVRFVPPVLADAAELKFRPLDARTSASDRFWCWTSTRAGSKALRVVADKDDPNFTFRVTHADEQQRQALQDRLWPHPGVGSGLVKEAWLVEVTVHEERQGKQMDMGSFNRRLSLFIDDEKEAQPGPVAKGKVTSDVTVGTGIGALEGKIELGVYDVTTGFHKHRLEPVKLRTEAGVVLKYLPGESYPPFLKVALAPNPKDSRKDRAVWNLQIDVPSRADGNDFTGTLPENAAIVLERVKAGSPTRHIRIQVEGTAAVSSVDGNPR